MKEFNLDAALNGEPVKLACGRKAYILYDLSRYPELLKHANRKPLNGIVMSYDKENECYPNNWLLDGKNSCRQDNIIGMWEDQNHKLKLKICQRRSLLNLANVFIIYMAVELKI